MDIIQSTYLNCSNVNNNNNPLLKDIFINFAQLCNIFKTKVTKLAHQTKKNQKTFVKYSAGCRLLCPVAQADMKFLMGLYYLRARELITTFFAC